MANILRDELIENNYVSTNNIDDELPPTHVVLYLKNISGIDKKTVIEPIPLQQVLLTNQNPSLKLIDNKAIFCLSPPKYLNSFSLGIWAYNGMQGCTPIAGSTQCNGLSFRANVTINGNYYPNVTFEINGGISNSTIDSLVYCYGDSVGDLHVTAKDGVGVLNINLQRINADGNYLSTWSDNVIQSSDGLLVTIKGNDG